MVDLYKILGVRRNASKEQIQKAFRKLSRTTHPDVGGDAEAFQRLHLAYTILMDDVRRARYDATGQVEAPKPDNALAEVLGVLSQVLAAVIQQLVEKGIKPESRDMVALMGEAMGTGLADIRKRRTSMQKLLDGLKAAKERFTVDDGENWLETIARNHAQQLAGQVKQLDEQERITEEARKLLKKYRYQANAEVLRSFVGMTSTTTSWTGNW